jgi:hypothetical protein
VTTTHRRDSPPRLNQPWRFAVAVAELAVAVVAVVFAVSLWHRGITTMVTPLAGGQPPLESTIFYGNWMAYAIGLVAAAAILVLDAIRETVLGAGTRRRTPPPEYTAAPPPARV